MRSNPISGWALANYVFLFGSLTVELFVIHSGVRVPDVRGMRRVLYGCAFAVPVLLVACYLWGKMSLDRFLIPDTSAATHGAGRENARRCNLSE
jgi:hypothetical protein